MIDTYLIQVDETLPVETYIKELGQFGDVELVTKMIPIVSIDADDVTIAAIEKLPFVVTIEKNRTGTWN